MNNKVKGNKFENDFAKRLSQMGYWVSLFANASHTGSQPADMVAIKNNKTYIIDCKTLENKSGNFNLDRLEENQRMCYKRLKECGNNKYSLAILWSNNVYFVPLDMIDLNLKSFNVNFVPAFINNFYEV